LYIQIAVNYPARKFGITRHEPPAEALKKCPDLVMVHVATYRNGDSEPGYWDGAKPETHKVSLDPYRRESLKILRVFSEFCPVVGKN
jgi:DNA polymerase eta